MVVFDNNIPSIEGWCVVILVKKDGQIECDFHAALNTNACTCFAYNKMHKKQATS